ncbi:MAG: DUF5312 domain-containing protein [Spirochaetaceae bacterium]|jgi:hypothetical protein|nr:DUF5312 domain-containing protein [Spirochaetaceae bacterium]
MPENNTFERLSSNLPQDDKLKLLEKIKSKTEISERQLIDESETETHGNNKKEFAELSWFKKIIYYIMGFFTGKNAQEVFLNSLCAESGRAVELEFPGIYDYQNNLLKQDFQTELKKLKEAARFFYGALDSSVNQSYGEFFLFLGSVEMPEIHKVLLENTDPAMIAAENPGMSFSKLRRAAINIVEEKTGEISEDKRDIMYQNARSVLCLKQLSSFLFDRLLLSFNQRSTASGIFCPIMAVKPQMISLNNILFSIKATPSINLLSSMFVFIMNEHENEDGFDVDSEMEKFLSRAETAIDTIRTFNRRIPLTRILRCASKDLKLVPIELSGGEDWFVKFRDTWKKKVNDAFDSFVIERRKEHINNLTVSLFGEYKIEPVENLQSEENEDGIPLNEGRSIEILFAFHKLIFMPEINIVLRPILINGEFDKKENKTKFTESYNTLIKLDDTLKTLTAKLSVNGEFGKRWEHLNSDIESVPVRKRKTQIFFEEVIGNIETILNDTQDALHDMRDVISGIINPALDSDYGTLSNLAKICGNGNSFMTALTNGMNKIEQMIILVTELQNINETE